MLNPRIYDMGESIVYLVKSRSFAVSARMPELAQARLTVTVQVDAEEAKLTLLPTDQESVFLVRCPRQVMVVMCSSPQPQASMWALARVWCATIHQQCLRFQRKCDAYVVVIEWQSHGS
jgi:hypothetical protein